MFLTSLTTIFGVGETLLIVCQLFLLVPEIYSKQKNKSQGMTVDTGESTMGDTGNYIPKVVVMDNNVVTERILRKTPRKKRNFVNLFKSQFNLNTTTSTCTPFFVPRTKIRHRKTTRWKNPIYFNMMQTDFHNELVLQRQNKSKIKKFFFPKHSSTASQNVAITSPDLMSDENNNKYKTTRTLSLPQPLPEKDSTENNNKYKTTRTLNLPQPLPEKDSTGNSQIKTVSIAGFSGDVSKNINFTELPSINRDLTTTKEKADRSSNVLNNDFTKQPFTSRSPDQHDFITQGNLTNESTVSSLHFTTINLSNTSAHRTNITGKKFHFKDLFHFTTALSHIKSLGSSRSPTTSESEELLLTCNTTDETIRKSEVTNDDTPAQLLSADNVSTTTLVSNNTFPFKKIFHIYQKLKVFPSNNVSAEKHEECNATECTLNQTYFGVKKQITSSVSQGIMNNISTIPEQKNTYHLRKIFNKHRKLKVVSSNSVETHEEFNATESLIKRTTGDIETQIPSQSAMNNKENQEKDALSSTTSSISTSPGNVRKYKHLRKMLQRERRTTITKNRDLYELRGDKTLKPNIALTNTMSEPSFSSTTTQNVLESKTDTCSRENYNLTLQTFKFKKQKTDGRQKTNYFDSCKENGTLGQSYNETTVVLKGNSTTLQERITTHRPFKIKYLMRFRSPVSTTQCNFNESSLMNMSTTQSEIVSTSENIYHSSSEEHGDTVDITTESMGIQDNVKQDFKTPSNLNYDSTKPLNRNYVMTTTSLHNFSSRHPPDSEQRESDLNASSTLHYAKTKKPLKFKDMVGFKQYKLHGKNINHRTVIPGRRDSHKKEYYQKSSTKEFFKDKINVKVYTTDNKHFRHWVFGKTTPKKHERHEDEEGNIFKWIVGPTFKESISITKPSSCSNCAVNNSIPEIPTKSDQQNISTASSYLPNKKIKNFFHFKTSQIPPSKSNTTVVPVSEGVMEEFTAYGNTTPIQLSSTTMNNYEKDYQTYYNNVYSDAYFSRSKVTVKPLQHTVTSTSESQKNLDLRTTLEVGFNSTDTDKSNASITKVYGHKKANKMFHKFNRTKMHFLNKTHNLGSSKRRFWKNENGTVILSPSNTDVNETKVEMRRHKKRFNKTVIHNASDVNDTSFNIIAFVMKPLDSLVSVFRAHSPNSVTKIGDVNATDIKNGTLPNHLQPPNSSIVILAVNSTNATSKDIHESKLDMALDLLGGLYHCVVNNFVEARPQDVHFYLYTRSNAEEPEKLVLPAEPLDDNTTSSDVPEPVFEKETKSEPPLDKREVEDDEDDDEDYEFEPINLAKSDIQSKWFNIRAETKVLIHGYLQDYQTDIIVSMREAYLSREPYNVIVLDWSALVNDSSCYPVVASRGLRQVGSLLAQLLNHLVEAGVSPSRIHIVGFSLGAHVAGHAGSFLRNGLISRITGLDPALPYVPMEPDISLDSEDAAFVDIIHTASGLLGQSGPMGHADFYPNGGSQQPGCDISSLSCSHRRSALYFIESISSERGFKATKCDSWHQFQAVNCSHQPTVLMGEPCSIDSSGKFYLATGYKSPYSLLPDEHVKVKKSLLLDLFYDFEDL